MSKDTFEPKQLKTLSESNQIKAYIHPTRITILSMLADKKRTISNVAKALKVHPANITHHFKLMEKNGLIVIVEKRDIGRNIEKYYRAVAYDYMVKPNERDKTNKKALALSVLKNDLSIAINTIQDNDKSDIMALLKTSRIHKKDIKHFSDRLVALINEFAQCDSSKGVTYNLNLSLYPNDVNCRSLKKIIIN